LGSGARGTRGRKVAQASALSEFLLNWLALFSNQCATGRGRVCDAAHSFFGNGLTKSCGAHFRPCLNGTNVPRVKLTAARAAFLHGVPDELMACA
jgi:hypothetical protein